MDQQRTLAEQLANRRLAITIGLLYSSFTPFVKTGFPIKPLPSLLKRAPIQRSALAHLYPQKFSPS